MSLDEAESSNLEIPHYTHPQSDLFETGRFERMFKNLKLIGEGAFGKVYKGIHKIEGKQYAIKRIFFKIEKSQNIQEHPFFREVYALTKLNHPSIVRHNSTWIEENLEDQSSMKDPLEANQYHELSFENENLSLDDMGFEWDRSNTDGNSNEKSVSDLKELQKDLNSEKLSLILNIQMSCYSKKTLKEIIEDKANLTYDTKLSIIKQLIQSLRYIHSNGFIHRDIKPSNIFFASEKSIIIGDFGLAIESYCRYKDKNVFGTFNYTAPEVEQGLSFDKSIDIYAAGVIFYELFEEFTTGHERFLKLNALKSQNTNSAFQSAHPLLHKIISKMVAPDPQKRYSSADEILESEDWKLLKKQRSSH